MYAKCLLKAQEIDVLPGNTFLQNWQSPIAMQLLTSGFVQGQIFFYLDLIKKSMRRLEAAIGLHFPQAPARS